MVMVDPHGARIPWRRAFADRQHGVRHAKVRVEEKQAIRQRSDVDQSTILRGQLLLSFVRFPSRVRVPARAVPPYGRKRRRQPPSAELQPVEV